MDGGFIKLLFNDKSTLYSKKVKTFGGKLHAIARLSNASTGFSMNERPYSQQGCGSAI